MKSTYRIFSTVLAFTALAALPTFRVPAAVTPVLHKVNLSLASLPIPTCGPGIPGCDEGGKGGKGGIF